MFPYLSFPEFRLPHIARVGERIKSADRPEIRSALLLGRAPEQATKASGGVPALTAKDSNQ